MDFKTLAANMFLYWIIGALVIGAVIAADERRLLQIKKEPILKWIRFLFLITGFRILAIKILGFHGLGDAQNMIILPWAVSFTVYWEDACHGLPLVILDKLIGTKWYTFFLRFPALLATMVAFGIGHLYQGISAAILLSFYIPYSMKIGKRYGFGTVMVCHILYDFVTILFVRYMLGR